MINNQNLSVYILRIAKLEMIDAIDILYSTFNKDNFIITLKRISLLLEDSISQITNSNIKDNIVYMNNIILSIINEISSLSVHKIDSLKNNIISVIYVCINDISIYDRLLTLKIQYSK